jgi:integrase
MYGHVPLRVLPKCVNNFFPGGRCVYLERDACLREGDGIMSVTSYKLKSGQTKWKADFWLELPGRNPKRVIKQGIRTRELAKQFEHKSKISAFEGTYFERQKKKSVTVQKAWDEYEPIAKRDRKDWAAIQSRKPYLLKHLGNRTIDSLGMRDIDTYRQARSTERTRRGGFPAVSTVNREVALLRQTLNHAVRYELIERNPLRDVKLLSENNVREVVLTQKDFDCLHSFACDNLKPILSIAFETGMRKREVLDLRWPQVNLKDKTIRLAANDTKTNHARVIALSGPALNTFSLLPRSITGYVFVNPKTGDHWTDIRKMFNRAKEAAGLKDIWFHDLRRSFATNWRRQGVAESVIMRMTGHKTREVFARYNIISEDDLHTAVNVIDQQRSINSETESGDHGKDLETSVVSGA